MSHLLQMRGLKPIRICICKFEIQSHLLQMRGLKLIWFGDLKYSPRRIFYRCVD